MNWNRRNTSEISIYNYPESLNPFYENENHKRLRFWNFSKEGKNRGRSFSIGNLRNIWSSYSFSPKKSSTLGINKTSESPPMLRRNVNNNDLDGSARNLKGFCDEFDRRSLQHIDIPRNSDLFFNRNEDYRRTTQFSGNSLPKKLTRSSQSSLTSLNPFEDEVKTDFNIPIRNKRYRKKSRAPQPPSHLQNDCNLKKELDVSVNNDGARDIKSLANEIELFVSERCEPPINYDRPETEEKYPIKENTQSQSVDLPASESLDRLNPVTDTTTDNRNTIDNVVSGKLELSNNNDRVPGLDGDTLTANNQPKTINSRETVNCTKNIKENPLNIEELDVRNTEHSKTIISNEKRCEDNLNSNEYGSSNCTENVLTTKDLDAQNTRHSIRTINNENKSEDNMNSNERGTLHYTESIKENALTTQVLDVRRTKKSKDTTNDVRKCGDNLNINEHGTLNCTEYINENALTTEDLDVKNTKPSISSVNIKQNGEDNLYSNGLAHNHPIKYQYGKSNTWKQNQNSKNLEESYDLPKLELNEPVSYYRKDFYNIRQTSTLKNNNSNPLSLRKSLSKTIESINRNQQLLNESAAKGTKPSKSSLYQCDENKYFVANELNSQRETEPKNVAIFTSNTDEILSKPQNNNFYKTKIFKTFGQYRESSPTSSNLDWNPLPKPKRSSN
ncbi:putative uncharacterized protein DDB_G0282133 [Drosophila subobscura]|uniref:putative uncharacterized protein DDB_G0282133 n=1 Tax=Drosophila subobscura TaxID=7241 RepID=UPI00155AACB4|nr:putative uncharacterized protein DDB_G0282133 [Drosophila subobscura]XP_034668275.1 putative uncharacterized protein DDB_G0282133 [Drosophila subobscura]XP_034668276.1 putative uncharacterized protein DDB_G0282133 [Drosophila subobscura]XP_034668277.1 putative uncharacterized protein DDB_G0282133 [Drosophila subobscura]XP_034668278.1 putative uncharacterized protein DDB_G0282133 [Drosophila subobscura]